MTRATKPILSLLLASAFFGCSALATPKDKQRSDPSSTGTQAEPRVTIELGKDGDLRILDSAGEPIRLVPLSERPIPASEIKMVKSITLIRLRTNPCKLCVTPNEGGACFTLPDDQCF